MEDAKDATEEMRPEAAARTDEASESLLESKSFGSLSPRALLNGDFVLEGEGREPRLGDDEREPRLEGEKEPNFPDEVRTAGGEGRRMGREEEEDEEEEEE